MCRTIFCCLPSARVTVVPNKRFGSINFNSWKGRFPLKLGKREISISENLETSYLCHWFILRKGGGRYLGEESIWLNMKEVAVRLDRKFSHLVQRFVVGEAGIGELFGRGDFFQDSSHCAYCC